MNNTDIMKVEYKEPNCTGLSESLDKYIKEKHTQEECIGFIDGFKEAKEQDKAIIQELLDGYKKLYNQLNDQNVLNVCTLAYNEIWELGETITKAEEYLK